MKQRVTKIRLEASQSENLILFGIVSHDPDYKLSLTLNKKFGISLKHSAPITIQDDFGNAHSFSRFTTSEMPSDNEVVYTLMSNRLGSLFLLKNLKNIDYLFYIHNLENNHLKLKIPAVLREMENIDAVFTIDTKTLDDNSLPFLFQ